jgi:predicted small secreted protein
MKTLTALMLAAIASLLLAGCNTIEGIGQDIKKAGGVIEDAAKKK